MPKCFFELFAYYQYLVLIYVANILDLKGERLNLYGGELNVACGEIAKKNIEYGPLIERAITDQQFHHLVSAYVAGNKSISGLSDERFSELLKFVGFEKGSKDPIMTSGAVSFSRILEALGSSYQSGDLLSVIMPTWIVHSNAVTGFRGLLNIKFKNAYPDRVI